MPKPMLSPTIAPTIAAAITPTIDSWWEAAAKAAAVMSMVSPGRGMPRLSRPTNSATARYPRLVSQP